MGSNAVLVETLAFAVPLRMHELLEMQPPGRRARAAKLWAERAADAVAHHGDMLMFRTKAGRRHARECVDPQACDCLTGTAQVFNAMAKGLAALALCPGGVAYGGVHWCVDHLGGLATDAWWDLECVPGMPDGFDGSTPPMPTLAGRPVVTVELPEVVGTDA